MIIKDTSGIITEHTYPSSDNYVMQSSAYIRIEQRRKRRSSIRSTSIAALICIAMIIASLSAIIVEAADRPDTCVVPASSDVRYYTSICIEKDDTLLSIARTHAPEGMDINSYVTDIRQLNNLHNDNITAGNNLIIYYYAGTQQQ